MNPETNNTNAATPLTFPLAEFQAGVTACLRSWSAFRTAVEGGWGGNDSIKKADDLRANIFEHMTGRTSTPSMSLEDFADNLAIYMEEEFSVTLEDGSEKEVAETLYRLYAECVQGKTALAEQLITVALRWEQQVAAAYPVQIQSTEHDDDDDDDDDDENDAMMDTTSDSFGMNGAAAAAAQPASQPTTTTPLVPFTNAADYASQSLCGKPKKPKAPRENEPDEVTMDDDGFATVTKSRRKARA